MYQEFFTVLKEKFPEMEISGENYPPHPIMLYLAYATTIIRLLAFAAILLGPQTFGIQNPPSIYQWTQDNKVFCDTICDSTV